MFRSRLTLSALVLATLTACHQASLIPLGPAGGLGARKTEAAVTVLAAGDIATRDGDGDERTGRQLDLLPGAIFALGDNAYPSGAAADFAEAFEPAWGRHKRRIHPVVGNHEYRTPGASAYFDYFGAAAGPREKGYYAVELNEHWRALVINSNEEAVGGVGPGSRQYAWLEAELTRQPAKNVIAAFHHPRFSSGIHGDNKHMQPVWELLVRRGVDIVLAGHDHHYERFHPTSADGGRDDAHGLRHFVVGTGGAPSRPFVWFKKRITAVREKQAVGVLALALWKDEFDWKFMSAFGPAFTDAGTAPVR